jgi:drug/metabolite transporter (DMT)-like permease
MGTLTHALADSCDWRLIALTRTALALVFTAVLARAAGVRLVLWRPRTLWIRSVAGSVSLICTFFALTRLPVSDVLTLTNTFPIWVALLSWPLLNEPPSGLVWIGVALGVSGVVLIQQPHLAAGNFASLIALASSVTTAIALLGLHRLQNVDVRAIVVHFSLVSLLFCVAAMFVPVDSQALLPDSLGLWPLLMLLGVGVTATVGQVFLTRAFAEGTPAKVAVVGLTQVVFAMAIDALLWQRSFNAVTLLGTALVLTPAAWLMLNRAPPVRHAVELVSEGQGPLPSRNGQSPHTANGVLKRNDPQAQTSVGPAFQPDQSRFPA